MLRPLTPDNSDINTQVMFFLGENRRRISVCEIVKSHLALLNRFRRLLGDTRFARNLKLQKEDKSSRGPAALQDLFHSVRWMI